MGILKYFSYIFIAINIFAALFAIIVFIWPEPKYHEVTAYCKVDNYNEQTYRSFRECETSLIDDIEKYGYVCGCTRTDGPFGMISFIPKFLM